ncbi:integrase [Mesorhizobium sp. M0659]|uniref:tyrosine-type recombinase/integrase n=1 Tax=Mesorhizobium sp. M0659 TaxID=2956980 RepID=UPI0033387F4B
MPGKPGDPEFIAAYKAAAATKAKPRQGALLSVMNEFQASSDLDDLAPRKQADYVKLIKVIGKKFGGFPLSGMSDRRTHGIFMEWRDERAQASRRQADYGWQVLARILSWGHGRGLVSANPCEKGGRLYRGTRVANVWTAADEAAFYASAPAHLHLPLTLALWTGQRQGDLLRLTWQQYDGKVIRLQQSKTGTRVVRRRAAQGCARGAARQGRADTFEQRRRAMDLRWLSIIWRKACASAGVVGVTFNDIRGTAVTRLALVEASVPEIATITGHSLPQPRSGARRKRHQQARNGNKNYRPCVRLTRMF